MHATTLAKKKKKKLPGGAFSAVTDHLRNLSG